MDIVALSMGLSQMKVAQEASVSLMKMAMHSAQVQSSEMVQMLEANTKIKEQSVNPSLGANIDIKL